MINQKYNFKIPNFKSYDSIDIVGNNIKCKNLFEINGYYPLIIGKEKRPQIWIYFKYNDNIFSLVEKNICKTPQAKISINDYDNTIDVTLYDIENKNEIKILNIKYTSDKVYINNLDLRPIGLNIFTEGKSLKIGNYSISGSTGKGDTFVGID